jgi:hypothetical protein
MKKVFMFLAVMLLVASTVFAGSWVVGTESSQVEQTIDETVPLSLGYSQVYTDGDFTDVDFASASIVSSIDNVELTQYLASIGYQVSDTFRPYVLLGVSNLEYDWNLFGSALIGENETWDGGSYYNQDSIAGTLLQGSFEDSGVFTYGFGITGDVKDVYKGITLTYDVRNIQFEAENNNSVCVIPELTDFSVNTNSKVEYNAWSAALIASKEFELKDKEGNKNKFVQSLTPSVGYKYTNVAMNIKTETGIPLWGDTNINVQTEQNVKGDLNTLLLGLKAKINDKWSVAVNGMVGDEEGFGLKTSYLF